VLVQEQAEDPRSLEIRAALLLLPIYLPPGQRRAIRNGKSFSHFDGESRLFQR
jgi:hypothetical protein